MAKRTTTKPTPTYPDPATPGFVEWVKAHLSKTSDRRAVLRVLDAVGCKPDVGPHCWHRDVDVTWDPPPTSCC